MTEPHQHATTLADRAAHHAGLFARIVEAGQLDERAQTLLGLYQSYELHQDYAKVFHDALRSDDAKTGGNACRTFDSLFQARLSEQLQNMSRLAPERFESEGVQGLARHDANTYATAVEQGETFALPALWERILIGLDHHQYKTCLIAQLMQRGIAPQRFHQDLGAIHTVIRDQVTPYERSQDSARVLDTLAHRHAHFYLDPGLCASAGYDQTRLMSDIYALKGDSVYWQTLESQIVESDISFGPIHLYWFRQEISFFEANRKSPAFNEEDLFAFGPLNTALLSLDGDEVLQGGKAGALRTAHGHSERGAYQDVELKKSSFGAALREIGLGASAP
ncbi:hypothetical protein IFT48_03775 [Pseudomonas fluorescens]|nr:hypothetical protein [Pseudomonas fluorescens]